MKSKVKNPTDYLTKLQLSPFAQDVLEGLRSQPKRLSSKYFYDDDGSRIFQEIMEMPEYYLTNAEFEILQQQAAALHEALAFGESYSIIELGAGDGSKTKQLLSYLLSQNIKVTYRPLDISGEAVKILHRDLQKNLPTLEVQPLVGDYFKVLNQLQRDEQPVLFLFLGSNIGNYEKIEAIQLLKMFGQHMRKGDKLLVGFDLKKNPWRILHAYNDAQGITRRFNLNLLVRMNRELGANFKPDQFEFYPTYDPKKGDVRSYIVS
ncbi:MAG: L-histidine N(alpha)-methyltransferase, partial [Bacteroidota bacterium]